MSETGRHAANIGNYLTDKEKIARAEGMLELAKAICTNKGVITPSEPGKACNILQITVDAVLCTLKADD